MAREALIEALAEQRFGTGFGAFTYAELTEHGKEQYRSLVRQDWPLIVAFVAEWLEAEAPWASSIAEHWQDQMSAEMSDA